VIIVAHTEIFGSRSYIILPLPNDMDPRLLVASLLAAILVLGAFYCRHLLITS
jgi:hypothetical protein